MGSKGHQLSNVRSYPSCCTHLIFFCVWPHTCQVIDCHNEMENVLQVLCVRAKLKGNHDELGGFHASYFLHDRLLGVPHAPLGEYLSALIVGCILVSRWYVGFAKVACSNTQTNHIPSFPNTIQPNIKNKQNRSNSNLIERNSKRTVAGLSSVIKCSQPCHSGGTTVGFCPV